MAAKNKQAMFDEELVERAYLEEIDEPVYSIVEPALIAEVLRRMGIGTRAVLEGTGISSEGLLNPHGRVSASQRIRVYKNASQLSTDPAFGLIVGRSLHLSSYGMYGLGLISSPTLASAVEFAFKYLKLGGPLMEKRARIEGNNFVFEARDTLGLGELFPLALEIWYSSIFSMGNDVLSGGFEISRLELAHPEPSYSKRYRDVFCVEVLFSAPANKFGFDASYLSKVLTQSSEHSRRLSEFVCDKLLSDIESHESIAHRLRRKLLGAPRQVLSLEQAAREMDFAPRTLRRKLGAEQTSFREIRREVRQALAVEYLCSTRLTTEEIAERMGFSDAANFRHAFKRWTKLTPSDYRSKFSRSQSQAPLAALWDPSNLHLS